MAAAPRTILSLNAFDAGDGSLLDDTVQSLVARRQASFGASSILFYRHPLHVVRAEGQYLHTSDGRRYLDFYNNVPSVGHCHPKVVAAIHAQLAQVNSHSRYLYDVVEAYAEKLLATFPAPLSNVAFTCTGSEANDLALRLARMATGAKGVIVTRAAYHGNTAAVTDVSPSSWKTGTPPDFVRIIHEPDPRVYGADLAAGFARAVSDAIADLDAKGHGIAALLVDTIFSSDGVFADPAGFLKPAVEAARAAGGLFIADEVQPGFGRTGTGFWGFARHDVIPDIVTLGKPMGNGYPLAGVVSRPGLMERLAEQFGYFNTFGGTPAAAAAGMAVLELIEEDDLIGNARRNGAAMIEGLKGLMARSGLIADIRGTGLYIGVEIAESAGGNGSNDDPAIRIVNALRDRGILIGLAGAGANVLKIRPPLCLNAENAEIFVETLGAVLRQ